MNTEKKIPLRRTTERLIESDKKEIEELQSKKAKLKSTISNDLTVHKIKYILHEIDELDRKELKLYERFHAMQRAIDINDTMNRAN